MTTSSHGSCAMHLCLSVPVWGPCSASLGCQSSISGHRYVVMSSPVKKTQAGQHRGGCRLRPKHSIPITGEIVLLIYYRGYMGLCYFKLVHHSKHRTLCVLGICSEPRSGSLMSSQLRLVRIAAKRLYMSPELSFWQ